jgi:CheY-like chemotaxis protein
MAMERAMPFDEALNIQYGLEEYPLESSLDTLGTAQAGQSKVRILRLVTTPLEGCELLRRLRSDPLSSNIPIIVLTR